MKIVIPTGFSLGFTVHYWLFGDIFALLFLLHPFY